MLFQHLRRGFSPKGPAVMKKNLRSISIHCCPLTITRISTNSRATDSLTLGKSTGGRWYQQQCVSRHMRSFSASTDADATTTTSSSTTTATPKLLYKAPMGDLITRLKRISITSCLLSVVGLPILIYLKNGTWPDVKQLGLGGFAFVSATGSTLALHFVFGPYILELYEIPRNDNASLADPSSLAATTASDTAECLYKATTRSILGIKSEILFDPLVDVTRYQGARPFANFVVKNNRVLYCHPELLDDVTRLRLLHPRMTPTTAEPTTTSEEGQGRTDHGVQRPADEKDGFL